MTRLQLPASVDEDSALRFLKALSVPQDGSEVVLDFSSVRFWIPIGVVALLAKIRRWRQAGKSVILEDYEGCPAFEYLQRIDFFLQCGLDLAERFDRRNPTGRFVPVCDAGRGNPPIDVLARRIGDCLCQDPDGRDSGLYDCIEYSIAELVSNVSQHSGVSGFVLAQNYPAEDLTRLAIADWGVGMLASFRHAGSPHWYDGMTDLDAIRKAVQPRVSSRTHQTTAWGDPINAGVGLTLLMELSAGLSGRFLLASGSGFWMPTSADELPNDSRFEGTCCAMSFRRSALTEFSDALYDAKLKAGLLKRTTSRGDLFS